MHKIPSALQKHVSVLTSPFSPHRVYLIGTAHVSKKSCERVQELIGIVKPKAVFLEICEQRKNLLKEPEQQVVVKKTFKENLADFTQGNTNLFTIFYSILLRKAGNDLESAPGAEFRAGAEAAKLCDATLVLGDRDIRITVQRVWKGMTMLDKSKIVLNLAGSLFFRPSSKDKKNMKEVVEDLDEKVVLDMTIGMGERIPWFIEAVLFERDSYMVHSLMKTVDQIEGDEPRDVVAIIGAGHVSGIVEKWNLEMKYPGSQINRQKLVDITRIPGPVTNDSNITMRDLR